MACLAQVGLLAAFAVLASGASPSPSSLSEFHRVKLGTLASPSTGPVGLVILARVNGGPPLRLLLDSGAQHVVLDKKAAARSRCLGGTGLDLVGAGTGRPEAARVLAAGTVEIGEILLRNVDVVVVERRLLDGLDGVMPVRLFAGYMITLDLKNRFLDLTPFPGAPSQESDPVARAEIRNGLLFVKGTLNGSYQGYFLLDTGATYNAISTTLAGTMNSISGPHQTVSVQAGTANLAAHRVSQVRRFQVGSSDLRTDPVVAVDLSPASRHNQLEVSGLLGYPALRDCVVAINYRDALVRIDRK